MRTWLGLVCCAALIAGCGGGSGTSVGGGSGGAGGGGTVSAPVAVTVTAGVTAPNVNIAVVAPATTPTSSAPNAQVLEVGTTAQSTGAVIHRGSSDSVFLCGPGLSSSMQVFVGGSTFGASVNDISVASLANVTCKKSDGTTTSGIGFMVHVDPGAIAGARTIYLQSSNNDITTFTGGLEVVP